MKNLIGLLPLLGLLVSCSVIKPEKPPEKYTDVNIIPAVSVINIPLEIKVADLEKMVNNQLKGLLYEDNSLEDNGGDNLMVKAWKKEDFSISVQDNILSYRIPLKLWIKAGWKVSKFGINLSDYREMNAEIALKFKTAVTLNPDWSLTTSTTSDGYDWLSTPVIKLGPVDVSVKALANLLLKANQKSIGQEIDDAITRYFDLKQEMQNLWLSLQKPVKVSDEYNVWITLVPQQVFSTPLNGKNGIIRHTIGISSVTHAFMGQEPVVTPVKTMPKLSISPMADNKFQVNLGVEITYDKVNELASSYLAGKEFTQGKYRLLINTINIYGSDNKFVIHLNVAGSLKGDLYFTGTPVFNDSTECLEVKDLDFDIKTRNALARTGSWLFHGTLTKMLQKNMVFPMGDQLKAAQSLLEKNLKEYKLSDNIYLTGSMDGLSLGDINLTPGAVQVMVILKGKVLVKTR